MFNLKKLLIYIILIAAVVHMSFLNSKIFAKDVTKSTASDAEKYKFGDVVEFGRYYDLNEKNEVEKLPIKWKVLDRIDNFYLLITRDIIKTMPYNHSWVPTNWRDSDIRFWLNYDFYDIAFNDEEKKHIKRIIIENVGNYQYHLKNSFQTFDHVFLLSIEEAKKYYKKSSEYMSLGTKLAVKEGLWISKYETSVGYSVWWLRSPGKTLSSAAVVHAAGGVGFAGDGVATRGNGVRPCLWAELK